MAGEEGKKSLFDMIRKAVEICMPDLRHYYRMTKKAKVVASYASDGKYYADVQPLRNDESIDPKEPVVPKVEIPIMWAGPKRGVVCPPVVGTFCDLSYYDGDPNYPRISNFRWHDMAAPEAALNEFVIQLEPGVEIRVDKQKHIVTLTPENVRTEAGKDTIGTSGKNISHTAGKNWIIVAGENATITAAKNVSVTAGEALAVTGAKTVTVSAPQITMFGNMTFAGAGGASGESQETGTKTLIGDMNISGTLNVGGTVTAPLFDGPATGIS